MKKLLLLLLPTLFFFTSCDLLFDIFLGSGDSSNDFIQQTVTVDETGDVYLIQVNNTKKNEESAYVYTDFNENVNEARSIDLENIDISELKEIFYNDTSFLNELKKELYSNINARYVSSPLTEITTPIIQNSYSNLPTKNLYVIEYDNFGKQIYKQKTAELITSNDDCNIWYIPKELKDTDLPSDFNENAKNGCKTLADKFSSLIKVEEEFLNSHKYTTHASVYIPAQEKIDIIVTDIFDDATDNQDSGTFGYFYSGDYYLKEYFTNSNESQCIYIDSSFLTKAPAQCYSTLLHEYAHLLEHTSKYIINKLNPATNTKETWYSEMIAMVTEDLLHEVIDLNVLYTPIERIRLFLPSTNFGFTNWLSDDKVLISYANSYVYGAYLVRNFGGIQLLKEIVTNPYTGKESIDKALKKYNFNVDFNYTVENQWKILFPNSFENDSLSLNKEIISSNNNKVKFIKIDISNYLLKDYNPYKSTDRKYVYPQGFYIHYVGNNIKSYNINCSPNMTYYNFVNK